LGTLIPPLATALPTLSAMSTRLYRITPFRRKPTIDAADCADCAATTRIYLMPPPR